MSFPPLLLLFMFSDVCGGCLRGHPPFLIKNMRDTVQIKLSVVDASNLEDFLLATLDKINTRATQRGYFVPNEKRFVELAQTIGKQTQVTDEEIEYTKLINDADDNQYKNLS